LFQIHVWNQTDIDDGNECDGGANCQVDCNCLVGFTADEVGGCNLNPPIETGLIGSVWNNVYFDSQNLPKSSAVTDYMGDYVNFSNSPEIGCFRIDFADYLPNPNDISYLRLDESLGYPNINAGEGYNIWEAENCGQ